MIASRRLVSPRKGQQHCAAGSQAGRTTPGQHARTGRLTPESTPGPLGIHMGTYCFWLCRLPRWLQEGASGFQDRQNTQWLVDKEERYNTRHPTPAETRVPPAHKTSKRALPQGLRTPPDPCGVILRGREGTPNSDVVTVDPPWPETGTSNTPSAGPACGPREIVLVLKWEILTLSLAEPRLEKHKVLFINLLLLLFFSLNTTRNKEKKKNSFHSRCSLLQQYAVTSLHRAVQ